MMLSSFSTLVDVFSSLQLLPFSPPHSFHFLSKPRLSYSVLGTATVHVHFCLTGKVCGELCGELLVMAPGRYWLLVFVCVSVCLCVCLCAGLSGLSLFVGRCSPATGNYLVGKECQAEMCLRELLLLGRVVGTLCVLCLLGH